MLKKLQKQIRTRYLLFTQITAIVGFLAIFILSTSLKNLQFNHGAPVPSNMGSLPMLTNGNGLQGHWIINFFLITLLAMFPLGIILLIFSSEARRIFKKYLKVLIIWLLIFIVIRVISILNQQDTIATDFSSTPSLPNILDPPTLEQTSIPSIVDNYAPPTSPVWLSYTLAFVIVLSLGVVGYFYWIAKDDPEDDLKAITLKTISEINQGRHWEDAIIECYARMNSAIQKRKQIQRKRFLTPAEFAQELISHGLPFESVQNLTQLFERARYGQHISHEEDKQLAIDYLETITHSLEATE